MKNSIIQIELKGKIGELMLFEQELFKFWSDSKYSKGNIKYEMVVKYKGKEQS